MGNRCLLMGNRCPLMGNGNDDFYDEIEERDGEGNKRTPKWIIFLAILTPLLLLTAVIIAIAVPLGITFNDSVKLDYFHNTTDQIFAEIKALQSHVNSLNITVLRAVIEELNQYNRTYPQLLAKLASLNQSQIATETQLEDTTKQLSSSIEALNYSLIGTETQLEDTTKQLSSSIKVLNYSLSAELWNKTSELTTDIEQATQHLQNSIASVADHLTSEITSTADELRSSIDTTAAKLDELQISTNATETRLSSSIEALNYSLKASIEAFEQYNGTYPQILAELASLNQSQISMETQLEDTTEQLSSLSTSVNELSDKTSELETEIEKIERRLSIAAAPHAIPVLTVSVALVYIFILY